MVGLALSCCLGGSFGTGVNDVDGEVGLGGSACLVLGCCWSSSDSVFGLSFFDFWVEFCLARECLLVLAETVSPIESSISVSVSWPFGSSVSVFLIICK